MMRGSQRVRVLITTNFPPAVGTDLRSLYNKHSQLQLQFRLHYSIFWIIAQVRKGSLETFHSSAALLVRSWYNPVNWGKYLQRWKSLYNPRTMETLGRLRYLQLHAIIAINSSGWGELTAYSEGENLSVSPGNIYCATAISWINLKVLRQGRLLFLMSREGGRGT